MIIFLYGPDTFRSRRWLQELKEKFRRDVDPGAFSLSTLDGQSATLNNITEKIGTGSLFVKKRMIVIDNIFHNKKDSLFSELLTYLQKFVAQSDRDKIIIFREEAIGGRNQTLKEAAKKLFNFLLKQEYSQEFKILKGGSLLSFIKKEAAIYNRSIEPAAALDLISRSGGDLWLLAGAIKKLAHRLEGQTINQALVKEMVPGIYDENIFGLTDAISARQIKTAVKLLEEQSAAGLSDEYLLGMLIRQFKILLQIRIALDEKKNLSDLPAKLKLHPFVLKKGLQQAKNFSAHILQNYLNRLIHLDYSHKKGRGDIKTELLLLISRL